LAAVVVVQHPQPAGQHRLALAQRRRPQRQKLL
jgi:hypothetical protein